jgi:hypothetical protein
LREAVGLTLAPLAGVAALAPCRPELRDLALERFADPAGVLLRFVPPLLALSLAVFLAVLFLACLWERVLPADPSAACDRERPPDCAGLALLDDERPRLADDERPRLAALLDELRPLETDISTSC